MEGQARPSHYAFMLIQFVQWLHKHYKEFEREQSFGKYFTEIGVLGFDSRRGLGILFTAVSRTALGPIQPPI